MIGSVRGWSTTSNYTPTTVTRHRLLAALLAEALGTGAKDQDGVGS